jgi:von Willebrand factor type A domain
MLAPILAILLALATGQPQPGVASEPELAHRISIRVVGPVALVEVEREVFIGEKRVPARDTVVDLDLPEGAALVDWGARLAGRAIKLAATAEAAARADYARTLSSHQLVPTPAPADDAARVRVHLAPLAAAGSVLLRYRYTAPAICADGRFVLRLPVSLEENPTAAQVTVRFDDLPAGARLSEASVAGVPVRISSSGRASVVHGTAPARAAWEVSFSLRAPAGGAGQLGAARAIGRGPGTAHAAEIWAVGLCRPQRPSTEQPSGEAMLLIDRSRSVGASGMSSQRTLVRALLEALPPAQRFNAILFARTATQVFPLPRAATREALAAIEAAVDPSQLENGTDLVAALGRAADWAKGGGLLSRGESRLLVIVSDGALPEDQTAVRLVGALASVGPGVGLRVLVLLVRPAADEPVPADAVERLDKLVARFGGTVRVLAAENLLGVVRSAVADVAQGGDLFNVRTQGRKARELAGAVAPGTGFAKTSILPTGQDSRVELVAERWGATVRASASAARVAAEWLQPLVDTQSSRFWAASLPEVAVFVEMVVPRSRSAADSVVRGQMDPLVLRNALALAFLPRARACYVSRRVANGIDLALRGRVRLELHLERGELEDAIIRRSSLGRPEIEACVREAAFQIEYPRPSFRDAPTVAAVNLVFRPRTPEEKGPADASAFDRELDLILGPVTFDPQKLLQSEAPESSATEKAQGD